MKYWINVISKDHALAGAEGGFIQANQGKADNLHLLRKEDVVFVYSPGTLFRAGRDSAGIHRGRARDRRCAVRGGDNAKVHPWRRKTTALACEEAPIGPLIPHLDFIQDEANWGTSLRRGLFEISEEDARRIANATKVNLRDG